MYIVNKNNTTKLKFIPTGSLKLTGSSLFRYDLNTNTLEEKREVTLQTDKIVSNTGHIIPQNLLELIKLQEITEVEAKTDKTKQYKINATKIRRKLHAWFNTEQGKKKISFITITFPRGLSDDHIYSLFNLYLTRLRKNEGLVSYLWVAERQKNGTIHYHLLTTDDVYINRWNNIMKTILVNRYEKNTDVFFGYNPSKYNGIDIAKNRKTGAVINFAKGQNKKAVSQYITKYITKNDTKMGHFVWHCSRNISVLFTSVIIPDSFLSEWEEKNVSKKVFENEKLSVFVGYSDACLGYLEALVSVNQMLYDTFLVVERHTTSIQHTCI